MIIGDIIPKATIKTKAGTEILIESDKETIEHIINSIQRREEMLAHLHASHEQRNKYIHGDKPMSLTRAIIKMKQNGYFKEPKTAMEIIKALEREALHYPASTVHPVLIMLVRRGELGRLNKDGVWVYVNR